MEKLTQNKNLAARLYHNDMIRYVFFGGCTTLVNLISYYILLKLHFSLHIANLISIILAILFAYIVNSRFVFQDKAHTFREHLYSFLKFLGARGMTMIVELAGVWALVEQLSFDKMLGKFITQFIVLVLNYIFSKFFVFTTGKKEKG